LWATQTVSRANSRNVGSTSASGGAGASIASVMPVSTVMNGGIGRPGLTSVPNSASSAPPRIFTAPISVIPQSPGVPPVVSRSTTTNVVSRSDRASGSSINWSRVCWTYWTRVGRTWETV